MVQKEIGERIAKLRGNMTQEELAKLLLISREKLSMWEQGRRSLKAEDVIDLCKHFGVSAHYLLFGVQHEYANISRDLGLSQSSIDALVRFKQDDYLYSPNGEAHCQGRCESLSKALSNLEFLHTVSTYLRIETGEPGFHLSSCYDEKEKVFKCWLSTDAYLASFSSLLVQVLNSIREGKKTEFDPYRPFILRD